VTWQAYGENLEEKLKALHDKVHRGSYRRNRPLSILCLEDKIVQQAVAMVLEAVHAEDFLGFSLDSGRDVASTMRWTLSMSAFSGGR
jgi:RNA-directed DNA polymerase